MTAQRSRIARSGRLVRVLIAYAVYMGGGFLLGARLTLRRLLGGDPVRRELAAQRSIQRAYAFYVRVVSGLGLIRVRTRGLARALGSGPRLVVANHPTILDAAVLISHFPQADCVVSVERAESSYLRACARAAGYVRNDDARAVVRECVERLREGRTVVLFPEGTRSPRGDLHPFRRGAAHIALETGCEVIPIVIRAHPPGLTKDEKWYDPPDRVIEYTLDCLEPISPGPILESGAPRGLAARRLTSELREHFVKGLNLG